jgi:hypothetical protein
LWKRNIKNFTRFNKGDLGMTYLMIAFGSIKGILEILFYMSAISLSFKAIQALNIYINKNSR